MADRKKQSTRRKATYHSWNSMLHRCYDPAHVSFPRYGGRGITVAHRWNPWALAWAIVNKTTVHEETYFSLARVTSCMQGWTFPGVQELLKTTRKLAFENFFHDMKTKPSLAHELDRVDSSKPYSPGNCRWHLPRGPG